MKENDDLTTGDGESYPVDQWLRRGLTPGRESVDHIVQRSLAEEPARKARTWFAVVVTGSAAVVLAAVLVAIFLAGGRENGPGAVTARGDDPVKILTITNVSGAVTVLYPPMAGERPARDELTIFSSNGIVVAFVPTSTPHHFIVGGNP